MRTSQLLPLTVLCGFLGSGKTTLLRRWRADEQLRDAAIIVHDLSDFGVDAELVAGETSTPEQGRLVDRVAALHGIHARDKLHESAGRTLREIMALEPAPTHVLCESTGAARPWPLITALTQDARVELRHFIVTVDALNFHRDFADGRVLTGEAPASDDPALQYAAQIFAEQLLFASLIILTKVVDGQVAVLKKLRPQAAVGLSAHGGLQFAQLDAIPGPKPRQLEKLADQFGLTPDTATADAMEAIILRDPRPFHPQRLHEVCQTQLGTGIYRTKGFLWLASRPEDVFLWQQSGSQIALEITGCWAAEAVTNRYGKLLPAEVELLRKQLEQAHPIFGDRNNELTLIGLPEACVRFAAALKTALCTEDEIAAWQRGESFADPWPKKVRVLR